MPLDPEFKYDDYVPIDGTRIFCGRGSILPAGYDRLGNSTECLRKGIAVGKKMHWEREGHLYKPPTNWKLIWKIILLVLLIALIIAGAVLLYKKYKKSYIIVISIILCVMASVIFMFYVF